MLKLAGAREGPMKAGGKTLRHQPVLRFKALVREKWNFFTINGSSHLITPARRPSLHVQPSEPLSATGVMRWEGDEGTDGIGLFIDGILPAHPYTQSLNE
ncbi:hypothetical protein CPLU01_01766 [Colletotrichum plurivorum]|uniref:Uncharacterized protein n=1 Tax=Colletotrichum plurivorum TaxID=2175906 RepID=A0A8H6NN65_9PEZI|nr:hypothetical protein CPLU01_01766 [Colletotrichum plurivorum]